jgi:molecular chaperone DnaK
MGRTTIDFGIDLGTSNSEIACMDQGELTLVKNMVTSSEVTPSVVKIDSRGTVVVGQNAYNELEYDPDNVASEFKRWMGNPSNDGFVFRKSQRRMTAAQLSAEVLKALTASASSRFGGEQVRAAVITVPAMFLIPACEDTKAAARLAGIEACPLLQEPVAAAIAYGYKAEDLRGNLLVFDLGGGTFDTTLIAARDGRLVVMGHDGDDKLGGKDYDWALVDLIVTQLRSEYDDLRLSRDGSCRRAMAKLKYLAEDAKKSLSVLDQVAIEVKRLEDGFERIDSVVQITKQDLEKATAHLTQRCLDVCHRLLQEAKLSRHDLQTVLIVGGQTKMPYVREAIVAEFGRADSRLDPMTVVASGAALFAATQRMPSLTAKPASSGAVEIKLAYQPAATDLDADVGISIQPSPANATIMVVRSDGGWSSGAIPVPVTGKVFTTVILRPKKSNSFEVQLRDASGALIRADGGAFSITHGLAVAQSTTSRAFGVALENNETCIIIPKGSPLPAKGTQKFQSAREVTAGDSASALRIYVLEGEDKRADRNYRIGLIELRGDELRRALPAGEAVELTYRLDESKNLSVEAVFPALREAKQMIYRPERPALTSEDADVELRKEKERLKEIQLAVPDKVRPEFETAFAQIQRQKEAAAEDPDARQKAAQQLIELKQLVDALARSSEWELMLLELKRCHNGLRLIQERGTPEAKTEYENALKAGDQAVQEHNATRLGEALARLRGIYWGVASSQDDYWVYEFKNMSAEGGFVDPLKAERLKEEGMRAINRKDIAALRTIVWELYHLLPLWHQGKLDMRFADAGRKRTRGQSS